VSLLLRYSDPRGISEPAVMVSLGSNIRFGQLAVTLSAEVGDPALSTVQIEDPGGVYNFAGLRAFDVSETSAPSNNSIIGRFAIQDRTVTRAADRGLVTGADRLWSIDVTDFNWHLASRILTDSDANRPVETAGDRIRWLLRSAANITLFDYGHVSYPTAQMDATDYRGQRPADLLADCAVESGYNFWCDVNEAHARPELFFLDPNGTSYTSTIAVSNVVGDSDQVSVFFPSVDAELRRSPSRLAYGVYLAYANGAVYVRNGVVGQQFGAIDQSAPMSNVKTAARARRVATKFLNDNDEEDDRLAFSIDVSAAQVNDVRHGMRMAVKFQHLPGYETPMYVRIVKKSVIQLETNGRTPAYRLALEAVGTGDAATLPYTGSVFAGILRADNYPALGYKHTQAAAPGGWDVQATVGPIAIDQTVEPFTSITVSADMIVRIQALAEWSGVVNDGASITFSVTVNGSTVGSDTQVYSGPNLSFWSPYFAVDLRSYSLSAGDTVSISGSVTGGWTNFGVNETFVRVGRGLFQWPGDHSWEGP
jgi:hypothetical protein